MGYVYKQFVGSSREARVKFLNDARSDGLEYVTGLDGTGQPSLLEGTWVLFRHLDPREEPAKVDGPAVHVALDGRIVGSVPIPLGAVDAGTPMPHRVTLYAVDAGTPMPHRVTLYLEGRSGPPCTVHVDMGDATTVVDVPECDWKGARYWKEKFEEVMAREPARRRAEGYGNSLARGDVSQPERQPSRPCEQHDWSTEDGKMLVCNRCGIGRTAYPAYLVDESASGQLDKPQADIDRDRRKMAEEIVEALRPKWFPNLKDIPGPAADYVAMLEKFATNWVETAAFHATNEDYWRGRFEKAERALKDVVQRQVEEAVKTYVAKPNTPENLEAMNTITTRTGDGGPVLADRHGKSSTCRCIPGEQHLPTCPDLRLRLASTLEGDELRRWSGLAPESQDLIMAKYCAAMQQWNPAVSAPPFTFAELFKNPELV
jgi:hypothetical protein